MKSPAPVKIIIAEDHQLFADGLEKLLSEEPARYQVIAKVYNGKQLIEKTGSTFPDLLLLDINMPLMNGLEAAAQIRKRYPRIRIIFVSMDSSPSTKATIQQHNFEGYVPKGLPVTQLKLAIDRIMKGEKIYMEMPGESNVNKAESLSTAKLSPRQMEIVKLIREGKTTNKELAACLSISVLTIETHLKNIFQLLDIKNKVELINYTFDKHRRG